MIRRTVVVSTLALAVALTGCGAPDLVWACATNTSPPTVLPEQDCPGDRNATGGPTRWYSAPRSDIEPDDIPVVGEELDGDFYDLADRWDLDESASVPNSKAKAAPKSKGPKVKKP